MFNFDEIVNRKNTHCKKWDGISGDDMLPMWVADMDFKCPPKVIEALKKRVDHGIFGYPGGYDSYYEAVIYWMKRRYHWDVKKEWITSCPGIVPALNMLVRALTNPGDKVVIQTPVYPPFFNAVRNNGCHVIENPLKFDGEKYTMDFEDLEKKFDTRVKLMILCSPHNPVTRVWRKDELIKLGQLCIKNNVIIISDEIHSDIVFKGNQHTVFSCISEEFAQNSVICNAPSKTFNIAGIQTSNIIIPNEKIRTLFRHTLESTGLGSPNIFAIYALEAAYKYGEEWLEALLEYLRGNFVFLKKYIEENLPKIKVIESEGTYLAWLDLRFLGLEDNLIEDILKNKAKVVLSPGGIFGVSGSGFQRINIGCPRSTLQEGLDRLSRALTDPAL